MLMRLFSLLYLSLVKFSRYDTLSDGLEDVAVDNNNMNKQTMLEDEEALDPIDDIWQETVENNDNASSAVAGGEKSKTLYKVRKKVLTRPYVAYEPLKNNCDSLKTWSIKARLKHEQQK